MGVGLLLSTDLIFLIFLIFLVVIISRFLSNFFCGETILDWIFD